MKKCTKCKERKGLSEFYKGKLSKGGLRAACKSCYNASAAKHYADNRETAAARIEAYYNSGPETGRAIHLKTKYGITLEQYDAMHAAQDGTCAICLNPEVAMLRGKVRRLAVDHCHEHGHNRALLCSRCNTSIGKFEDDPELLRAAANYIEEHAP